MFLFFFLFGWYLLFTTSAGLLLPRKESLRDRLYHCLSLSASSASSKAATKIRILTHLLIHLTILLPLAAYLWTIDELFFRTYRNAVIQKPLITISVPRAGTTSFHRALAKDPNLVTPFTSEIVMPFLCVNILLHSIHAQFPSLVNAVEKILKRLNGVTPEVEARHPLSLFSPEADDVLVGEWHWVAVGCIRTFPVLDKWWDHYDFASFGEIERRRILSFHSLVCKKVMYLRSHGYGNYASYGSDVNDTKSKCNKPRLFLRSHLSAFVEAYKEQYPDAIFISIVRDPVDVLRSFAGLSDVVIRSATGVRLLPDSDDLSKNANENTRTDFTQQSGSNAQQPCKTTKLDKTSVQTWPDGMQIILNDMMEREAELHDTTCTYAKTAQFVTGKVDFSSFKNDLVGSIGKLYDDIGMIMTDEFRHKLSADEAMESHGNYKSIARYTNPTLEEMNVNEERFVSMPGVQRYRRLQDD